MYKNGIKRPIKNFKDILKDKKKKSKFFLGRTFSAKLFIRLCSKIVDPSIICMEILNFEKENRTKGDIETVLPWMKNLKYVYEYISMKETETKKNEILRQIIWLLYRKIFYQNTIIKKNSDNNKFLYILLEGNFLKYDLVIYRKVLSLEEYLIYLIKMEILKENEIINRCKFFNKSFVDINADTIQEFIENNNCVYNYENMKNQALKEIIYCGAIFPKINPKSPTQEEFKFKSIDNYLKLFLFKSDQKSSYEQTKAYYNFYLGKYVRNGDIKKGQIIGNFLKEEMKDNSRYITTEKCIVGVYDKAKNYSEQLNEAFTDKMKRIFEKIKNNFFIFHDINENNFYKNYIPYMHYRKYYKGEKIFLQNSLYEGIFLLIAGTIKLSIKTSIDEMYNIMTYLTYSLNNFKYYVSGFKKEEHQYQENKKNNKYNISKDINDLYMKEDIYELMTIKEYNIIGTNETYEHKTEIYNCTAECVSDSAILYFFPKTHFNTLLNKEKHVYNSFIDLIEYRIKDIIWNFKQYIETFEREIKKKKIIKLNFNHSKNSLKNMLLSRNNSNNVGDGNKFFYDSKTYFDKKLKIKDIKSFSNEIEKNKDGYFSMRQINSKIKINKKFKIPKMQSIFLDTKKNFFIRNNSGIYNPKIKTKKEIKIKMPNSFPYLIFDSLTKRDILNKNKSNNKDQLIHRKLNSTKPNNNFQNLTLKKLYTTKYNDID